MTWVKRHIVCLPAVPIALITGETPLHLLCTTYHMKHDHGKEVAKRLIDGGADINARTLWGDTAAHYCGRWSSHHLLEYLLNEGIEVEKRKELYPQTDDFFANLKVSEAEAEDFRLTLLQKVAKSACIIKANLIIERIMRARNKVKDPWTFDVKSCALDGH